MITPYEANNLTIDTKTLLDIEKAIDESIKQFHGWYRYECAIISGEYSIETRNAIGKRYKDAGWKYVYHQTSSENGERAGLTSFIFSNIKLTKDEIGRYKKVI